MTLITDANDKRLEEIDYSGTNADWNLALQSLRAALAEVSLLRSRLEANEMHPDMTTAYLVGYHKRDDVVRGLKAQLAQANEQLNAAGNKVDNLRAEVSLLRDMLDAAVEARCKCGGEK